MLEVFINGAMEYDLVGEPLIVETFSSKPAKKAKGVTTPQNAPNNVPNIALS
jgi:hypothetical protein